MYLLALTYTNQNESVSLLDRYDTMHECDIAKFHHLRYRWLNDSQLESGYEFLTCKISDQKDIEYLNQVFEEHYPWDTELVLYCSIDNDEIYVSTDDRVKLRALIERTKLE